MPITNAEANDLLGRANHLDHDARRAGQYVATYFRAWGVGSIVMGAAMFLFPLLKSPVYVGVCFALWVLFILALLVFYYRGRSTRPRKGPEWVLAIVGGTVPWSLSALVQGLTAHQVWWLAGAPWLAAGLVCAAFLFAAGQTAAAKAR